MPVISISSMLPPVAAREDAYEFIIGPPKGAIYRTDVTLAYLDVFLARRFPGLSFFVTKHLSVATDAYTVLPVMGFIGDDAEEASEIFCIQPPPRTIIDDVEDALRAFEIEVSRGPFFEIRDEAA